MKINVKQHVDSYKDQKGFDRVTPVSGTYDVVNAKVQWQKVGAKGTEKLRIITHVLHIVEAEDMDGAKKMVGQTFGQDIWWNLEKDGQLSFNGKRLVHMAIACGNQDELDVDDKDSLVPVLTGVPYRIKIFVKTTRSDAGKEFYDVDVSEAKHLSPDAKKKYLAAPDWKKLVGPVDTRRLEDADYSGDKAGGGSKKSKDTGKSKDDDDDLPF